MARMHTRIILCLAASCAWCSLGAETEGNPREPSCVQGEAAACAEHLTENSPRTAARVQRSRAATLRRLLRRAAAGRSDVATGLTVGRPDLVRRAIAADAGSPTCYLARSIVPCWRQDEALRQLCSPEFSEGQAIVEIGPAQSLEAGPAGPGSQARVVANTQREIVVRCFAAGPELLVLRGTFLTGMDCAVDSVSQLPLRVNYVSYGAVVPPGEHEVRFLARPPQPWLSVMPVAVVLLGLGIAGVLVWRRRRRRG